MVTHFYAYVAFGRFECFCQMQERPSLSGMTSGASRGLVKRDYYHIASDLEMLSQYLAIAYSFLVQVCLCLVFSIGGLVHL